MNKQPLIVTLACMLVLAIGASVYLATGARPNLGLDLQGGISAVYEPVLLDGEEFPDDFEDVLDETIEVIRARVDSLGIAEPDISRSGRDVVVQLPGVTDAERLQALIGRTAQLTFRPVSEVLVPGDESYDDGPDCADPIDEREPLGRDDGGILCESVDADEAAAGIPPLKYRVGPAAVTGERIDDAFPVLADAQGYAVSLQLDRDGGEAFAAITADLACERDAGRPGLLAIVLDGVVESAPTMATGVVCGVGIRDGSAQITVGGSNLSEQEQQARDLALVLRTGALPISLQASTFEQVSATLGAESLRSGLLAGLIGLALVGAWLIWFYRWLGVVALSALAVFGVYVLGLITALSHFGFALTLAGVAGLIVSIGITADSSIIFFERIRDEVNLGKTVRTAVRKAYESAFRTNLAGNTVTLAAAVILYFLAVGPVRGFALMLGIATILDLIIMWGFTRPVVWLMSTTRLITRTSVRAVETASAGGTA
ncbi:MAG: protein translocase subunit SecD [Nitriliruptoraceae bacterium]